MLAIAASEVQFSARARAALWPALGITIGAAGVVATSLFYLLSPPETVLPFVPLDLVKATLGAARGAATLHIAGLFGIISDAIFGSAAMVFAARAALGKGAGGEALGWMLLGVGTLVFISVDTILGFVLPALAAASVAAFLGFKIFADVLFALGEVTFGLGAALLLVPYILERTQGLGRAAWPALLFGLASLLAGVATLAKVDLHDLVGLAVSGSAVAFVFIGLNLMRWARL
ncbi:MAG: hypothetical protein ACLQL2_12800 [Methylovirgula sp.]